MHFHSTPCLFIPCVPAVLYSTKCHWATDIRVHTEQKRCKDISKGVKTEEQKCPGTTQLSITLITKRFRHHIALCNLGEIQQNSFVKLSRCWTRPVFFINSTTQEQLLLTSYVVAKIFIFVFLRSGSNSHLYFQDTPEGRKWL